MTHLFSATRMGLCPGPWDFYRHENNPTKPETEKAEAHSSGLFGLLLEYSLNRKKSGLTSVAARFMITATTRSQSLKNKNNLESSHE